MAHGFVARASWVPRHLDLRHLPVPGRRSQRFVARVSLVVSRGGVVIWIRGAFLGEFCRLTRTRACPSLLSQLSRCTQPHSHALTPRTRVAQDSKSTLFVSCPKNSHTSSRNVTRCTSHDNTEHVHTFLIFDTVFLTCLTSTSQRA